jgi:hypothetical protein
MTIMQAIQVIAGFAYALLPYSGLYLLLQNDKRPGDLPGPLIIRTGLDYASDSACSWS